MGKRDMRTVLNLLHLQIDNRTSLLKTASPKKMLWAAAKVLLALAVFTVAVAVVLFTIFMLGVRVNAELLSIVLFVTQVISLCFAVGHVASTLFLCQDNEMLICLPVTPNQLFISKALLLYLRELGVNAMMAVPLLVSLGYFGGFGTLYYLCIPLYLLLLPIFPIVLASFISIPLMAVVRFLKSRPALSIAAILALVGGCLFLYFSLLGSFAQGFDIAGNQLETVRKINGKVVEIGKSIPLYFQLAQAMLDAGVWFYVAIFVALSAALSVLTVLIIRPYYFKTAMSSLEKTTKSKVRAGRFGYSSPFWSLVGREMRCVFRSPSEVFEYFLFTLLMPFIVFSYDKLLTIITVNSAGVNMIAGSHVMIVAIMAMLSNLVSASAISREGGNFHTSKTIPISYYTQIFAKLTFNAIFTGTALLLTMGVSFFMYPAWQVILGTVAVIFAAVGHIAFSMDMDLKSPTVNVQGDTQSSTVSKSTPKSLIWGLIIGFVMGMVVIMSASAGSSAAPYLLLVALALGFALYRIWMLILRINLAYDKIEM